MTNKSDYQINSYEDSELTLKKVFGFLKRSWIRIVVYALILALIAAIIVGSILIFKVNSSKEVVKLIDLNFEGASEGLDPRGQNYKPYDIKDSLYVSEAILRANEAGADIGVELQNKIASSIKIEAIVTEDIAQLLSYYTSDEKAQKEIASLKYNSTRYKISISNPKKIGLTNYQAQVFLNQLIEVFSEKFNEKYFNYSLISVNSVLTEKDYIELGDIYENRIKSAVSLLSSLKSYDGTYVSNETGNSFQDLINEFNNIANSDIGKFVTFVEENGISDNVVLLKQYLQNTKSNKEIDLTATQEYITKLESILENYAVSGEKIISGGQTIEIQPNTEQYDLLVNTLNTNRKNESELKIQIEKLTKRIAKFNTATGGTEEQKAAADAYLEAIEANIDQIVTIANKTIKDYMMNKRYKNAITSASSAVVVNVESDFTAKKAVIVVLIAAVIGAFIAMIVTASKEYNLKRKIVCKEETHQQSENE